MYPIFYLLKGDIYHFSGTGWKKLATSRDSTAHFWGLYGQRVGFGSTPGFQELQVCRSGVYGRPETPKPKP